MSASLSLSKDEQWKKRIEKKRKIQLARTLLQCDIAYSEVRLILEEIFDHALSDSTLSILNKNLSKLTFTSEFEKKWVIADQINHVLKQKILDLETELRLMRNAFKILTEKEVIH